MKIYKIASMEKKQPECPDCEVFIRGKWRIGRCDCCHGNGVINGEDCKNCDGTGWPACCRCEGTGTDMNPD